MNTPGIVPFDGRRWVAGAALLVFVASILYSLLHIWQVDDNETSPQQYVEALREVLPELKANDRVLIHPPWREDVWQTISGSLSLPAGVDLNTALSRAHGAPLHRVWLLHDNSAPLPRSLRLHRADAKSRQVGEVEILFFESRTSLPNSNASLDTLLANAEVSVFSADGKKTDCRYRASTKRHECPGLPEWMYVGAYEVIANGKKHSCVWNHPASGGRVVTHFRHVELPDAFSVFHALSDRAASMAGGAAVDLRVRVDGREIANIRHPNQKGWMLDAVSLGTGASSKSAKFGDVEVEVQTARDGMRHFCWSIHSKRGSR